MRIEMYSAVSCSALYPHCKQAEIITLINGYLDTSNVSICSKMKLLDVFHLHFSLLIFFRRFCSHCRTKTTKEN